MADSFSPMRVNVGCGATPTFGWLNFDNSPTVRLAELPLVGSLLSALPESRGRLKFLQKARATGVRWASAAKLPLATASMEVVYTSHMLEHLSRDDAEAFLREAYRVLKPGGVLRVSVPDLAKLVDRYLRTQDADSFIASTLLSPPEAPSFSSRLRNGLLGNRGHAWMYDERSLCAALGRAGFVDVCAVPAGETRLASPEPLDLWERSAESLYVEGTHG